MKFLKSFLFTISFCFVFGSIMSLCGYCQALPELTPDSSGFEVIQGGANSYYDYSGMALDMYMMSDPFVIDRMYDSADTWLKDNTGYDIEHSYQMGIDGTVFVDGGAFDVATANWLANKMSQGTLTAAQIAANNYRVFSHSAKQFGANAKEWFLGQLDPANNKITNISNNIVTKFTTQGLSNYLALNNSFKQNDLYTQSEYGKYVLTNSYIFHGGTNNGTPLLYFEFSCNKPIFLYTYLTESNHNLVGALFPTSYLTDSDFTFDGYCITNGGRRQEFHSIKLYYTSTVTINGISYSYGMLGPNDTYSNSNCTPYSAYSMGVAQPIIDYLNNNLIPLYSPTYYYTYNYNSSVALDSILSRLENKYVDNNTLNSIVELIQKSPVVIEYVNNEPIPVAEPSQSILDDIETIVENAIDNSLMYQQLIEPYEEPGPIPDPEPSPNNQGTDVPEDFPTTIFSPINDSVGSIFDFVSIFEPLFYIFSFSSGLLGLWLVVPFVILFLILFRLLK